MYKTRIKSWGLDKNFKECEVVELFRLRNERDRVGKRSTTYMIRGREVDWDRVQNYVRRKGLNITQLLASSAGTVSPCAREISCYTPPPEEGRLTNRGSSRSLVDVNLLRVSSPSSSSPSPSPPSSSSNHLFSTAPIFTPISPAASNILPLLDPSMIRRPSYPLPPPPPLPIVSPPPASLLPTLYPPPQSQQLHSPSPLSTLQNFQLFLARLYKTTMFQDGERAWGTTDFFLRNMRSLEWLSTIRYALAINKTSLVESTIPEIKTFKAINRAFAVLEPSSKGVIGSRLFYIVNFLGSFYSDDSGTETKSPLTELAGRLMEDIVVKCFRCGETDREGSGFGGDLRRVLSGGVIVGEDKMEVDSAGDDETEVRLMEEGISVGETANRFLMAVLERMLREVGLGGVPLGVVLMHDLPGKGNMDVVGDWKPKGMRGAAVCGWKSCLLSPVSPSSCNKEDTGVELLESGIWLVGYGDELKAEVKFRAVVDRVKTGSSPLPKMTGGSTEMKVLARCSHYQLASIYWRRGEKVTAKDELKLSVKESVLYDHFVQWEDVDFLYV
ncbi:hypothetical protein QBC41DRAFT_219046 [Cercophora samala]|uniref:Uncharacterized protein n=1 Tax=Cercophora samala TaxID=330535 RepID=A0AA40DDY0_9PEZI|nr:hypothetical protein QBC41DRAFT_219046 [Cercophora samala]